MCRALARRRRPLSPAFATRGAPTKVSNNRTFDPQESIHRENLLFPSGGIAVNRRHSKGARSIAVQPASDADSCENREKHLADRLNAPPLKMLANGIQSWQEMEAGRYRDCPRGRGERGRRRHYQDYRRRRDGASDGRDQGARQAASGERCPCFLRGRTRQRPWDFKSEANRARRHGGRRL